MNIIALQTDIVWEAQAENYRNVASLLAQANPAIGDLIVLPEMFACGYSMNTAKIAEPHDGPTAEFIRQQARQYKAYVLAGLATQGQNGAENQALLAGPDGQELARYTKVHPFGYVNETDYYVPGNEIVIASVGEVNLCPAICYDLRFPELFRAAVSRGANLFAVIASWPASRSEHWHALLKARAIENQAYVVGVNRCGKDPNVQYGGGSVIFGPRGETLAQADDTQSILRTAVDMESLTQWRNEFPALADIRDDGI